MDQRENLVKELNDLILKFDDAVDIRNYAILIEDQIILAPTATHLSNKKVLDILSKLNIDKLEKTFQKGVIHLVCFEFEDEIIYYLKGSHKVQVVVIPPKDKIMGLRDKLYEFIENLCDVVKSISELPDEEAENIQKIFTEIETIIEEFQVPKFETYKKLVKFAVPFKKKK